MAFLVRSIPNSESDWGRLLLFDKIINSDVDFSSELPRLAVKQLCI